MRHFIRRGCSSVLFKAAASQTAPLLVSLPYGEAQKRSFHLASLKAKYQQFVQSKSLYITEINNTALKYGLFGVAVGGNYSLSSRIGNPSTWVVSLISWINSLGMPWWGAIAGGSSVVCD